MNDLSVLREIFDDQRRFNELVNGFRHDSLTPEQVTEWTKEFSLLLGTEVTELLNCTAFKGHRREHVDSIKSNATEQLIDIFKYWLSLALLWGMTPEQLLDEYHAKSAICELRYKQEVLMKRSDVAIIDIDGVLCDYKGGFCNYLNKRLGMALNPDEIGFLNHATAGVGLDEWETIKHDFRQLGIKRRLPVLPGAVEFTQELKASGYSVVILSSRPYKRYKRIFKDTMEWLGANGFEFDAVLWETEKHEKVMQEFDLTNVRFAVEDDPKYAAALASIGVRVYLVNTNYNQAFDHPEVIRVESLAEVIKHERENR